MAQNPVEQAVEAVDGPTKASYICQVSVGAIWKWRKNGIISDALAAYRLAQASGVPIEALIGVKSTATSCDAAVIVPSPLLEATASAA